MINKKKPLSRALLLILTVAVVFSLSYVPVFADVGPKPSITITIKNPPAETYYVALIYKHEPSHWFDGQDELNNEEQEIREYFENYYVDGYSLFESPVGYNIKRSNSEGKYEFYYMVPDTFKVLIVTSDGKEYVSNEITTIAFDAECVYDVSAGVLRENVITVRNVAKVSIRFFICFVLTVAMEAFAMLIFSLTYHKNFDHLLIINLITQILLNVVTIVTLKTNMGQLMMIIWLATEIAIIIIEAAYYCKRLQHKDGDCHPVRNVIYGVTANILSLLIEVPVFLVISFINGI